MKILVALGQSGTSKLCAFEENNIQSFSFKMPICMALKKLRRTMAASTKCLRPITINGKRRLKKHRFLFPIQLKNFSACLFPEEEAAYREQIARIPLTHYSVGEETARRRLNTFINQKLRSYENKRDFLIRIKRVICLLFKNGRTFDSHYLARACICAF